MDTQAQSLPVPVLALEQDESLASTSRLFVVTACVTGLVALLAYAVGYFSEAASMQSGAPQRIATSWMTLEVAYPLLYVLGIARAAKALSRSEFKRAIAWATVPLVYAAALAVTWLAS